MSHFDSEFKKEKPMSDFDYEFKMENEFDTGRSAPALTQTTNDIEPQPERERYYKETVREKKGGIAKFLIIAVVCASLAAPLLGLAIGIGQKATVYYFDSLNPKAQAVPEAVKRLNEPVALSPITVAAPANSIVDLVKQAKMSVVNITTSVVTNDYFYRFYFYGRDQETPGSGTGIVFREDGENVYIMTNYHVIENANKAFVSFIDREQIPAKMVGADRNADIAVISVLKSDLVAEGIADITVAKLGDSSTIEVGEWVVAIGNALGNGKTVTYGIISAINKEMDFGNGSKPLNFIQTDAAINPGNSGGALINMNGDVIGMNTAKIADYRVDGMGFAIPISSIVPVANDIVDNKTSESGRPFIGISGASITKEIVDYYSLIVSEGVIIETVYENGGASDAGIRQGDIIIEFDGQKLKSVEQLQSLVAGKEVGSTVKAKIIRNNEREIELTVSIKSMADVYTVN